MFISKALDLFCLMVDVRIPYDVLLFVRIAVGGCGCSNSFNVDCIRTSVFHVGKDTNFSASTTVDITHRKVLHSICIGPFYLGSGVFVSLGILLLR